MVYMGLARMSVSRLIYISTARDDLEQSDLDQILLKARDRNHAEGVTGFLLYNGRNFMQALEGPKEAVERIFDSICHDPRHQGVVRIALEEDVDREFADWSMGYGEQKSSATGAFQLNPDALSNVLPVDLSPDLTLLFTSFNTMPELASAHRIQA